MASFGDGAYAIAVDTASPPNIYVTGLYGFAGFPDKYRLGCHIRAYSPQSSSTAVASGGSAFITKLTPSAAAAWHNLHIRAISAGNFMTRDFGVAVDGSGNAYIAGATAIYELSSAGNAHYSAWRANQSSREMRF